MSVLSVKESGGCCDQSAKDLENISLKVCVYLSHLDNRKQVLTTHTSQLRAVISEYTL